MLPTKEQLEVIEAKGIKAERYFKNRALMVIETLCLPDFAHEDIEAFKDEIYKIAHSAIGTCEHKEWRKNTERKFKSLRKQGF